MESDTISTEEVAERLHISLAYVYRLVNEGRIPVIRLGRRVIIPRAAWERWFEAQVNDALKRCSEDGSK